MSDRRTRREAGKGRKKAAKAARKTESKAGPPYPHGSSWLEQWTGVSASALSAMRARAEDEAARTWKAFPDTAQNIEFMINDACEDGRPAPNERYVWSAVKGIVYRRAGLTVRHVGCDCARKFYENLGGRSAESGTPLPVEIPRFPAEE